MSYYINYIPIPKEILTFSPFKKPQNICTQIFEISIKQ